MKKTIKIANSVIFAGIDCFLFQGHGIANPELLGVSANYFYFITSKNLMRLLGRRKNEKYGEYQS